MGAVILWFRDDPGCRMLALVSGTVAVAVNLRQCSRVRRTSGYASVPAPSYWQAAARDSGQYGVLIAFVNGPRPITSVPSQV